MKHKSNNPTTIVSTWARLLGVVLILALMAPVIVSSQPYANPTAVNLLTAGNFVVLSGTTLTIAATCTATGNVGGVAVTNNGTVTGTTDINNAAVTNGINDLGTVKTDLAGRAADATPVTELGGTNLGRGIYSSGTFGINGTLTLTGTATDRFIFKTTTTLITGGTCVVNLVGVLPSNVYWEVGSAATIDGAFKGNILAGTFITLMATGTIDGKALAQTAVTLNGASVLPVEFVAFAVTANRLNANLNWSTATETNNYGFEIERRQGSGWVKVGFVPGAGTSSTPLDYSYTDNNLAPGRYAYRIKQIDKSGSFSYHSAAEVEIGLVAKKFELESNYPNPFNPSTTIQFMLADAGKTSLLVYNMLGQQVMSLFDGNAEAGRIYQVKFDASSLPSGLYVAKLQSGQQQMMQKMILMK